MLQKNYGFSNDEASLTTTTFLKSFRSCPDNPQTTLDSWRSYLWLESLPKHWKHLNHEIYEQWLQLRYRYLAVTTEYENLLINLRNGYRLALITNGPSNAQWEKIKKLKVCQYFDCVLVSADFPWEKPHPNIFLAACNFLNVKPHECMMIGDKLETDIQGGKDAKLGSTVWIPPKSDDTTNVNPKPDLIVKNLCEILQYLPKSSSPNSSNGSSGNSNGVVGGNGGASCSNNGANSSHNSLSGLSRRNVHHPQQQHHHQSTSMTSKAVTFRKPSQYRRVSSLLPPEMDCNSENSCDSCYS